MQRSLTTGASRTGLAQKGLGITALRPLGGRRGESAGWEGEVAPCLQSGEFLSSTNWKRIMSSL